MYCKHCGKIIDDDSSFCKYCGKLLVEQEKSPIVEEERKVEQVKPLSTKNKVANEIFGNLRMVLFAIGCWLVFMVGFLLYHYNDIKPYPETQRGSSCYDSNENSFVSFCEKNRRYFDYECSFNWKVFLSPNLKNSGDSYEDRVKKAKERAKENYYSFRDFVNEYRFSRFEADLKLKAQFSAYILLSFFVIGRYIVKLSRWVLRNKTV